MKKPTVYIFMNKSLGMSAGKLAAQAAHAMALVGVDQTTWNLHAHRTVMIMQARDEQHLTNIVDYLLERDVMSWDVIDEGVNEIDTHSITALATQVVDKDDARIQDIFSTFKLYRDTVRLKIEVDR